MSKIDNNSRIIVVLKNAVQDHYNVRTDSLTCKSKFLIKMFLTSGCGGSYCIANYVAEKLQVPVEELDYQRLTSEEVKEKLGDVTFVTATDGNHGRGIAWTANRLGVKSKVFMPKGSSEERLENIRAFSSDASITDMNYDDTVRYAKRVAEENGWPLVQDTAWEGYEKIPV